jgi:hypothetical protein
MSKEWSAVANLKEFRLTIEGTANGVELTPETMPMARLAEYLFDLAAMMGYKESVHLVKVDNGSATPVMLIDADEEARITDHLQKAQLGRSDRSANLAYRRFETKLREDNAFARVRNVEKGCNVIEFIGRNREKVTEYGPIRERASVVGEVIRVGGKDETVPVWLKRVDGDFFFYCDAKKHVAQDLGHKMYVTLRLHGIATWKRDDKGTWTMVHFSIQSFDPEPLSDAGLAETLAVLRAIPDNGWLDAADPLADLREIRHGEGSQ